MKPLLTAALATALLAAAPLKAEAQDMMDQRNTLVLTQDLNWQPGPPALPPGSEAIILYGDPTAAGEFTMRLKLPANYQIPPHTHPSLESVTVIEGTLHLGMGPTMRPDTAATLASGSFFAMPPGMTHYAYTGAEGAMIQLSGIGPWDVIYENPMDDPRAQVQLMR